MVNGTYCSFLRSLWVRAAARGHAGVQQSQLLKAIPVPQLP